MNLDYLNQNSLRNYPIKDDLSRVSGDGLFTIPNSLITDISLCSSELGDVPNLYISRLTYSSISLTLEISANGLGVFGTFQASLPFSDYNIDVALVPGVSFPSATGLITLGSADDLSGLPFGDFTFNFSATALLMRTYSPISTGISWMSFSDTQGNTKTLTGYVELQGNSNMQFRVSGSTVFLDAGEGLGLNKICSTPSQPILTINGIAPDSNGNFTLIDGNCIQIDDAQYGLVLTNSCGQPCLGCAAIDTLTTQVNSLESSVINLKNFTDNLQTVITQATNLISIPCQCN